MIDLQARLDALPEWPQARWQTEGYHLAVLARLALAREWIAAIPCEDDCGRYRFASKDQPCTCGRDALLAALEVPK